MMTTFPWVRRPAERWTRMLTAATAAASISVLVGCQAASTSATPAGGPGGQQPQLRVETVQVRAQDLARTVEMPGTVEGYQTADLYAKVGGYLEAIMVDIGDRVREGQPLATISIPEMLDDRQQAEAEIVYAQIGITQAQAAVHQAKAEIVRAEAEVEAAKSRRGEKRAQWQLRQAEFTRIQGLVESGALEDQRRDEAQFQLDAAEAALGSVEAQIRTAGAVVDAAKAALDKTGTDAEAADAELDVAKAKRNRIETMLQYASIRAPFDGVVTKRWVDPGAYIQPAEGNSAAKPLLTVTQTDTVRVFLDVPMAEVRLVNRGDRAVLDRINVLPGKQFAGEVTRFSSALDLTSRMMRVEVDLSNPEDQLLPGYYGYVTLFLRELPGTPVVPSSALLHDGQDTFVYVIEEGICRKRVVEVTYQDGVIAGIASGLEAGEQVVRAGGGELAEGQPVIAVLTETG